VTAQPSPIGRGYLSPDGRRGVLAGLESGTVAELRAGDSVHLDLARFGVCPRPLSLLDGDWMAAHPDMGLMAIGPVLELTGPEFDELAAGRVVEREVDGTALWEAFPVRIAQAETTGELQERFAALDEGRVAPQVGQ